jgi:peptidoglycan hydrolase-like protein with peptidoglycan-binding domain
VVQDGRQGAGAASAKAPAATVTVESATGFGSTVRPGPLRTGGLLRTGSRGRLVALVKRRLRDAGYAVSGGARYDAGTEAAVRRFQTDRDLLVDGIVGRQTMASLLQ